MIKQNQGMKRSATKGLRYREGMTIDELKEVLHYDPFSGYFYWINRTKKETAKAKRLDNGMVVAGSLKKRDGYLRIRIRAKEYLTHRLAWFYITGRWPDKQIDHINRVKTDNCFSNLREATCSQNNSNKVGRGRSKFKGVSLILKTGKWMASIKANGKTKNLGSFKTEEEAALAYNSAARVYRCSEAYLNLVGPK